MKNKHLFLFPLSVLLFSFFIFTSSCKKEPGAGGNSSIKGNVSVRQYNASTGSFDKTLTGADEDVYIIYGDEVGYGDRLRSDYEGDFEFKYLRRGKYKVYLYSIDSAAYLGPPVNINAPRIAVIKEIEVTDKKQTVDAGTIIILKD